MVTMSTGQPILSRISQRVVLSVHRIECLREISKDSIQLALLLPTLLLQLYGSKYRIHGVAACVEATLTLRQYTGVINVFGQPIEHNSP